jgi:hypothetical protein
MRVQVRLIAAAYLCLCSILFFGCGGLRVRREELIKADLVGQRLLNARINLSADSTLEPESGSVLSWTIKPSEIQSLHILRRRTEEKEGTDTIYGNVSFHAAKVTFPASRRIETVFGNGDLKILYRLHFNGWHLDSVEAASPLEVSVYSAVSDLRTLDTAELIYSSTYSGGFGPDLRSLGLAAGAQPSPKCAGLVDDELASGTKGGYRFTYIPGRATGGRIDTYTFSADPADPQDVGDAHYFTDQLGVIRRERDGPAGANSEVIGG